MIYWERVNMNFVKSFLTNLQEFSKADSKHTDKEESVDIIFPGSCKRVSCNMSKKGCKELFTLLNNQVTIYKWLLVNNHSKLQ